MIKSKTELPDYFGFYNAAFTAYAKTLLNANQLMLGYTAAATRTLLRSTALATPAAAASESHDQSTAIEAALYADDVPARSIASSPAEVTLDPANDSADSPPLSSASKKTRRRRKK